MADLNSFAEALGADVVIPVTVTRTTCHAGPEDFEGERCPRCGINLYDWQEDVQHDGPLG